MLLYYSLVFWIELLMMFYQLLILIFYKLTSNNTLKNHYSNQLNYLLNKRYLTKLLNQIFYHKIKELNDLICKLTTNINFYYYDN